MTDLTFVHGNAAQRSAPPVVQAGKGVSSQSESQIVTEFMQQAKTRADGGQASEARRWKDEHDKMAAVASELAFKATNAAQELRDAQARHKNLQENHQAMQSKYRGI